MNILFLSNDAPNYFHFFNSLAGIFRENGAKIYFAADCQFSIKKNRLDQIGVDFFDFKKFANNHVISKEILHKYDKYNLNYALLSDFERSEINGVWGKVDTEFFEHLKSALLSFYEYIFEKNKINFVLYENVSNTFAYFALFVAQERGAQYIGLGCSRIPGRFSITNNPLEDISAYEAFKKIENKELLVSHDVKSWAENYISKIDHTSPDYMSFNKLNEVFFFKRYLKKEKIKILPLLISHVLDRRNAAFQVGNPFISYFNLFRKNLLRRIRVNIIKHFYDTPSLEEKFLLYPLHFHPESSTSVLAGAYLNEYEVIRNIAFSLPQGIRLYVKDHLSAWGYQPFDFYRKIKNLPNVYLLEPNSPTKEIIKKSIGVVTLTSTVGYEALLLKKRVFLLGRVFYEFHKGVIKINDPMRVGSVFSEKINDPINWTDEYNNNFICAYYYSTYSGTLNLMLKNDEAKKLAKNVYPEIMKCIDSKNKRQ